MIKIENLSKSFLHNSEKLHVLDNLNLEVKNGEFLVLFGPNGCGKTTLLNILGGIENEDSGKISMDEESIFKNKVGFVFQNYNESLFPWYTVENNIALSIEANGENDKKNVRNLSKKYLKSIGLEKFASKYPYQLSGGMKQLVSIVRAFAYKPDFFLMDEPFSKNKKTIIFVSHDIEEAVYLADRVVVFSKRPAKVKSIFEVKLKRPRTFQTRSSKEFFEIKNKILEAFRKEI